MDGQDIAGGRRFDGIWSFDEQVLDRLGLLVSQIMERPYEPIRQRNYEVQNTHISEISGRMIDILEQTEMVGQRRRNRFATLQQATEVFARDSPNLLKDLAQLLHVTFGASGVVVAFSDSSKETYTVSTVIGDAIGEGWTMPILEGVSGRAIQQSRLMLVEDVRFKHESDPLLPTAKSLIAAPILGRFEGVITISTIEPNQWNEEDGQMMMSIARMLALHLRPAICPIPDAPPLPETVLKQALAEQQGALLRLLTLEKSLRSLGNFTPHQLDVLRQMHITFAKLIEKFKITRDLVLKG